MAFATNFLNPVFDPLLQVGQFWTLFILSVVITIIITVAYKYTTDQKLMKSIKEQQKKYQQQIKENRSDPKKAMAIQKEAMALNMKYMTSSFKSTIYTFLPIIIIYGWMSANLAFAPIAPGMDFTTTLTFEDYIGDVELIITPEDQIELLSDTVQTVIENQAQWTLNARNNGEFLLEFKFDEETKTKTLLVDDLKYEEPIEKIEDSPLTQINLGNKKFRPLGGFHIGSYFPGWLMTYIIISLVLSTVLRKLMKVY